MHTKETGMVPIGWQIALQVAGKLSGKTLHDSEVFGSFCCWFTLREWGHIKNTVRNIDKYYVNRI